MAEIILARHGETEWNVAEIFRGRIDVGLNETGLKQAERLAEYLSERKIEAVYTSPLQRACKTAAAVARTQHLTAEVSNALNDISFGDWEGLPLAEVTRRFPVPFKQWLKTPHLTKLPGGDSLDDVTNRAMALVIEIIGKYQGSVVFVSHRVVHKVLILALLGLDNSHFWNIWMDTAAITTFSYENGIFVLKEHNNTSYLKALEKPKLKDF